MIGLQLSVLCAETSKGTLAPCDTFPPRTPPTSTQQSSASGSTRSIMSCRAAVRSRSRVCSASSRSTPSRMASGCRSRRTRPTSTRFPLMSRRSCRAAPTPNAASRASSAGTPRRWSCARTRPKKASADTSRRSPRRRRCTKSASTISSAAGETRATAPPTSCTTRATPHRASTRAYLEGRLDESHLENFRREPQGRRRPLLVLRIRG